MGNHSDRLKARNNGKAPYTIDSASGFDQELGVLMSRLQGHYGMWLGVSAALARAQHRAQRTMDEIEEQVAASEGDQLQEEGQPEGEQEDGQDEDGKPKVEYPH